ncbi:MAG: Holliday junction resolvase RuvX [Halanaerobiales bacterium]|nr:Holliday junction resolvase RuvX [Halanaerobiales bacterium]
MLMGIDPGKHKCGIAILTKDGQEVFKDIFETTNLSKRIKELFNEYSIENVIVGNGTYADKVFNILDLLMDKKMIKFIDEKNTTYLAEQKYLKENPPFGLQFLNKIIKFKPQKPLDDYVAVILVEKYLDR